MPKPPKKRFIPLNPKAPKRGPKSSGSSAGRPPRGEFKPQSEFRPKRDQDFGGDRPARPWNRDSNPSDSRPPRRPYGQSDSGPSNDRPARPWNRDSNPSDSRPPRRPYGQSDSGPGNDRPARPWNRDFNSSDSRPPRRPYGQSDSGPGNDRPARPYNRDFNSSDSRPPRRPYGQSDSGPGNDRPARPYNRDFNSSDSRPPRRPYGQSDSGPGNDRPGRPYNRDFNSSDSPRPPRQNRDSSGERKSAPQSTNRKERRAHLQPEPAPPIEAEIVTNAIAAIPEATIVEQENTATMPETDIATPEIVATKPETAIEMPVKAEAKAEKVAAKPEKPTAKSDIKPLASFSDLGLSDTIASAVSALGFETPTPIQAQAIPVLLSGRDLIGNAQTGTGKTAAFGLPVIQKIDLSRLEPQALIMAPTRELAVQVAQGIHEFSKNSDIRVVVVYGGQPIDRQFRALRNGAHIVVGTPGRLLDHLRRGSLKFDKVTTCVLDEADEMLALGFAEDMELILSALPEERQLALFSATMPQRIMAITQQFLRNPVHVEIRARQRTVDTTNQTYYEVPKGKKLEALARVLDMETPGPTIVFCRTRQDTNDLCENLRLRGYNADALHGDMGQQERDRVMRRFREGQADLLVATDVAARGLDIETVTHVINYDIPWDVEQYIHRIGRTGRAGRSGDAITLVSGRERAQLRNIERMIGSTIKPARIPTAGDIASKRREVFMESLKEALNAADFDPQVEIVDELSEEFEPTVIAAAALNMLWKIQQANRAEVAEEMEHDFEQPEIGMTRLFIGMGRQDGLRPSDIVGAIANESGLTGKSIGVIEIFDRASFVEVPSAHATSVVNALGEAKIRNRRVKVQFARPSDSPQENTSYDRAPRRQRR